MGTTKTYIESDAGGTCCEIVGRVFSHTADEASYTADDETTTGT